MKKLGLAIVILAAPMSAFASSGDASGMDMVSVAGGIAHSSQDLSLVQNPAGLANGSETQVDLHGFDQGDLSNNWGLGGYLLTGGSSWGGGVGVDHFSAGSGSTDLRYGLGVKAESLGLSFGVSGSTAIQNGNGTDFNLGARLAATQDLTLAAALYGLDNGPTSYGFGAEYKLGPNVSLVGDVSADNSFNNVAMAPGILVGNEMAAITYSYGFALSNGFASSQFQEKSMVGVALKLEKIRLNFYYHEPVYADYYIALAFGI